MAEKLREYQISENTQQDLESRLILDRTSGTVQHVTQLMFQDLQTQILSRKDSRPKVALKLLRLLRLGIDGVNSRESVHSHWESQLTFNIQNPSSTLSLNPEATQTNPMKQAGHMPGRL